MNGLIKFRQWMRKLGAKEEDVKHPEDVQETLRKEFLKGAHMYFMNLPHSYFLPREKNK